MIHYPDNTGNPPDNKVKLSIIIVNWNTCDLMAGCLVSIFAHPPTATFEVIVVDNASTDGSVEMIRECFPHVTLIENTENVGFARANNQALRLVIERGGHALLLNSDTRVCPGAIQNLLQELLDNPRAGAVGPTMLNPDYTLQSSYGSLPTVAEEIIGPYLRDNLTRPWGRIGRFLPRNNERECRLVHRVSFACTLVRGVTIHEVGLLDESFAFYSEDYDFFKRLRDAGWQVLYCPTSTVIHYWGASSRKRSEWALRQLYLSKRIYFEKHYGERTRWILDQGLRVRFSIKMILGLVLRSFNRLKAKEQIRMQQSLLADLRHAPGTILLNNR